MTATQPNIVQAEFFHVGATANGSLEEVTKQAHERILDGLRDILAGMDPEEVRTGIKTVVRFYDIDGVITATVQRNKKIDAKHRQLASVRGLRGFFTRLKIRRQIKKLHSAQPYTALELATAVFAENIKNREPVGVERADRRFRLMREDEAHELMEATSRSKGVWLFVFKPNDLLADKMEGVASIL